MWHNLCGQATQQIFDLEGFQVTVLVKSRVFAKISILF